MPPMKTSILVVDDDIRILRMIQRMLELEDHAEKPRYILTRPGIGYMMQT